MRFFLWYILQYWHLYLHKFSYNRLSPFRIQSGILIRLFDFNGLVNKFEIYSKLLSIHGTFFDKSKNNYLCTSFRQLDLSFLLCYCLKNASLVIWVSNLFLIYCSFVTVFIDTYNQPLFADHTNQFCLKKKL